MHYHSIRGTKRLPNQKSHDSLLELSSPSILLNSKLSFDSPTKILTSKIPLTLSFTQSNFSSSSSQTPKAKLSCKLNSFSSALKASQPHNSQIERPSINPLRTQWKSVKIPTTPSHVVAEFSDCLSQWEVKEIREYPQIYFIGKSIKFKDPEFDNEAGDYKILIKDHLAYRYEIVGTIGKGSFGQVIEAYDHCNKKSVAIKIIKNKQKYAEQARIEVDILEHIILLDNSHTSNIIEILENFTFRNHLCIVFELYSLNLYEVIKKHSFKSLPVHFIRQIALQIFQSLYFLSENRIIHCDIKPENILLVNLNRPNIKLIDFGSSCFESKRFFTYIQSRFYRAPEVILGIPYTPAIDVWSFGCVLAEIFTGFPLFPGEDEADQLSRIIEVVGPPPIELIKASPRKYVFFNKNLEFKPRKDCRRVRVPGSKPIRMIMAKADEELIRVVEACLQWDPEMRIKPADAINLEYFEETMAKVDIKQSKHRKISLEDITKNVPNLQKFIAHRSKKSSNDSGKT